MTPDQLRTALRDVPDGGWPDDASERVAARPSESADLFAAAGRRCGRAELPDAPGWTADDAARAVLLAALPVEDRPHLPWADLRRGWDFGSTGHGDVPWEDCFRALNAIGYDGPIPVEWEDAGMDRLIRAPEALAFARKPALDAPPARPRSTPHSRGRTEAGAGPVTQPVAGLRLVGEDSVRPSPFSPAVCHHQSQ